ncbi:MAG: hypothetical protein PHU91_03390 [Candidatus Omnitrophica bacterium]|nr:hypothetical protein [Candidatus Omnitrophota bacterium]MDD5236684.1 hypothetical protein [Candidatus Omnitrophota bacterium]MDD5610022.1 hypothetical protein [Candidatus Omnitrophota bacterium]
MRFNRFLSGAFFVTAVSLFYVYQQTSIYTLAYSGEKKQRVYQDLLDKNNLLRYNLNVVTSLSAMGNKVLEASEFEMPAENRIVKLEYPREKVVIAKNKIAEIFNIFGFKSQAEARTVNH